MATQPATTTTTVEHREQREQKERERPKEGQQLVIVELSRRRSPEQVRRFLDEPVISNAAHWSRCTEPSLERPSTPVHSLIFVRLSNDAMSTTVSSMSITTRSSPGLRVTTASGRAHGDR